MPGGFVAGWPGADTALDINGRDAWDRFGVAGLVLPGIATVTGELGQKIDRKDAPGKDGGTITTLGYESAKFQVQLKIWTQKHLDDWYVILQKIQPVPGKKLPPAVQIRHQALAVHGIHKAIVAKIALLKPGAVRGTYETTIFFEQWLPSGKKNVTNTPGLAEDDALLDTQGHVDLQAVNRAVFPGGSSDYFLSVKLPADEQDLIGPDLFLNP